MKKVLLAVIIVALLQCMCLYAAQVIQRRYAAALQGSDEVPPVQTVARGIATLEVNKDMTSIEFKLTVNDVMNPTEAHIHLGTKGTNGPVVVSLYKAPKTGAPKKASKVLAAGRITKADLVGPLQGKTIADLVTEINKNNAYVNVHTTQNPDGEIRGWLIPLIR